MNECNDSSDGSKSNLAPPCSSPAEITSGKTGSTDSKGEHKQKRVSLVSAKVDVSIAPIVEWLNSLSGVFTYCCCQGGQQRIGKEISSSAPMVSFFCFNEASLTAILLELKKVKPKHHMRNEEGFFACVEFPNVTVEAYTIWSQGDSKFFEIISHFVAAETPLLRYTLEFKTTEQMLEFVKQVKRESHENVNS